WAEERGIYEHSTPEAQLLKALSELGELADAVIKNDREALIDAIGDVAVCMVNYAKMAGVVFPEEPASGRPAYSDEYIISVMCSRSLNRTAIIEILRERLAQSLLTTI